MHKSIVSPVQHAYTSFECNQPIPIVLCNIVSLMDAIQNNQTLSIILCNIVSLMDWMMIDQEESPLKMRKLRVSREKKMKVDDEHRRMRNNMF